MPDKRSDNEVAVERVSHEIYEHALAEAERERFIDALREHHAPGQVDGEWQVAPALGGTGCPICKRFVE
jgi:hypothetical protein